MHASLHFILCECATFFLHNALLYVLCGALILYRGVTIKRSYFVLNESKNGFRLMNNVLFKILL
jgi:hypothetical protein